MNIDNQQNRDRRNFQLRFLREVLGLSREDRFLDYGCGPLRLGRKLIPQLEQGNYVGVDISTDAIWDAWCQIDINNLRHFNPTCIVFRPDRGVLASALKKNQFDIIWAFSVLIHMTDERLDEFLKCVQDRLAPGGRAYANVNLGKKKTEGEWNGFPVVWRTFEELQERATAAGLECLQMETLKHYGSALNAAADAQVMVLFKRQR